MTSSEVKFTVTVCTRNRAQSLAVMLNGMVEAARRLPKTTIWDLQIVDNGSNDETPHVIASFKDRLPIRRTDAPVAGLSNARNVGACHAIGEFIIWTDDDVAVDPDFLIAYDRAFREHPSCSLFGGKALPRYEQPETTWFVRNAHHFSSLLAIRDQADWTDITFDRVPYGLNYAVRTSVQQAFPYDPAKGVAPGRRRGGEETSMIRSALAAGETGKWVWSALVWHLIPRKRQTLRYVFEYYRSLGADYPVTANPSGIRGGLARYAFTSRKAATAAIRLLAGRPNWPASLPDCARGIGSVQHGQPDRRKLNAS